MLGSVFVVTQGAEVLQPFVVETCKLAFVLQPDGSRTARAIVTNHTKCPQQISVVLPSKVPVESGQRAPFSCSTSSIAKRRD
jgi:hypothetical protein